MNAALTQASVALQDRFNETYDFDVGGMTCASCVGRVGRALKRVPGVRDASVNLATERASVTLQDRVEKDALVRAIVDAGYTASEHVDAAPAKEAMPPRIAMVT